MRIIVCGSRDWTSQEDRDFIFLCLDLLQAGFGDDKITIIEGECRGVDTWARQWAIAREVDCLPFPADWSRGRSAGPQRNLKMLQEGNPDLVLAFTDDITTSKGTKNMVELAKKHGVTTKLCSHQELHLLLKVTLRSH